MNFVLFFYFINAANFYFPDDYNQLCPYGSGLLSLPVSTSLSLAEQPPYAGTLLSYILNYFDYIRLALNLGLAQKGAMPACFISTRIHP